MKKIVILLTTFGFTGHIPILSAMLGSVEGILISLIFNSHIGLKYLVFGILFILGVYASSLAEKDSGIKDDHNIVIDEVMGGMAATFFLPQGIWPWVVAFIIFRIFDWTKPFPIRRIEHLPGGIGVVGDDVLAGLYSLAVTWGIYGCRIN